MCSSNALQYHMIGSIYYSSTTFFSVIQHEVGVGWNIHVERYTKYTAKEEPCLLLLVVSMSRLAPRWPDNFWPWFMIVMMMVITMIMIMILILIVLLGLTEAVVEIIRSSSEVEE